jgi:hypothetical protein
MNSRLELISVSEIEMYQNKCDELEKEIEELVKKQEKVFYFIQIHILKFCSIFFNLLKMEKMLESQSKFNEQNLRFQTHEGQMNLLNNDYKILNLVDKAQSMIFNSISNYSDKVNSTESVLLQKYSIIEILTGIKVKETHKNENSSWFDILFMNLPDEFLDNEGWKYMENYSPNLKAKMNQLSDHLLDKYTTILKVRLNSVQF